MKAKVYFDDKKYKFYMNTDVKVGDSGGQPNPAALASDMIDTSNLYLYLGSESGYQYGYIYAYVNNEWTATRLYGKGEDGYTPSVTVTQTTSGATITVIDENGTTTANLENGTATDEQVSNWLENHPEAMIDDAIIASAVDDWLDDHPEATTTVQDGTITMNKLASSVKANLGGGSGALSFCRLPYQLYTSFAYQGWCQNNIVEYNGEFAAIMYCRSGHTGTSYATKAIFFKGYEIDHVETCTINGVSSTSFTGAPIGLYEYNGMFYMWILKTMYESSNLVDWVTSTGKATPQYNVWSPFNLDGTIYYSYDNGYNVIGVSEDNGATITNVSLTFPTNENRNEASFIKVNGEVFAFFGKQWTTGTTTSESGYASMAYTENGVWQTGVITTMLCNLGDTASYFDGAYIHVLAKSRRYHLNGGDASILRHYRAKVEDAKLGNFELVQRVDNYNEELPRYALDSTAVSMYIKKDGTGLMISPVSVMSGRMVYQFYALNAPESADVLNNKYELEIQQIQQQVTTNDMYALDKMRLVTFYDANIGTSNLATFGEIDAGFDNISLITVNDEKVIDCVRGGSRYINTSGCDEVLIEYECPLVTTANHTYLAVVLNSNFDAFVVNVRPSDSKILSLNDQTSANNSSAFALSDPKHIYLYFKNGKTTVYFDSPCNGLVKIIVDDDVVLNTLTYYDRYKTNQNLSEGYIPVLGGQTHTYLQKAKICAKYTPFLSEYSNTTTSGVAYPFTKKLERMNNQFTYLATGVIYVLDVGEFTTLTCSSLGDFTTRNYIGVNLYSADGTYINNRNLTTTATFDVSSATYAVLTPDSADASTYPTIIPTT